MTNSALEVKNLTKDYGDFVLDKLNFTLPRGVIMGLIGENGAGKSTTINCILNESFNRFLIISLDVLICRYSPLFRAFPALFISEEPHKSFYYPLCFRSQK